MGPDIDAVRALPVPAWLAKHSDPDVEAIVAMLGPEMQQRYRRCLAEEVRSHVRSPCPGAIPPCLRALTRAQRETERLDRARHPEHWPR